MPDTPETLDDLRRQIDLIDDEVHDGLMRRAALVEVVARVKKSGNVPTIRPGREAQILRRLAGRHRGRFPLSSLLRIWREILSGATAVQGEFAVAVFLPDERPVYWDMARDHFGSNTPMSAYRSVGEVVRAVTEGRAMVGVLPIPEDGDGQEAWWRHLGASDAAGPRVIVRLPFASRGNARGDGADALVIGRSDPEPSGDDRSLLVIEASAEVSRARLISALLTSGLQVTLFAAADGGGAVASNLVEIDDLIEPGDQRLTSALVPLGEKILRVSSLGFYARPFTAAALGERGARTP